MIRRTLFIFALLFLGSLAGCRASVPVDPRDVDTIEEISLVSRNLDIHIRSDYWGPVTVTIVPRNGGRKRLGMIWTGSNYRKFTVGKAVLGSSGFGFLMTPMGSTRIGIVFGSTGYLLTGIWISRHTQDLWLDITTILNASSVTWY